MTPKTTADRTWLGRARLSERPAEGGCAAKLSNDFAGSVASETIRRTARSGGPYPATP